MVFTRINNDVIIQGGLITNTTKYTFPISFTTRVFGFGFSQSAAQSANVGRLAFASFPTITGFTVVSASTAMVTNGAYYIVIGY